MRLLQRKRQEIPLPPPLVGFARHPFKWLRIKAETFGMAAVLAHIGMLIVVGLYYVLFEAWHPATVAWHNLVPDSYTRHLIRDVGEGFLGGFLAQQVIWNHFKKTKLKQHLADRVEIALHIPNIKCRTRLAPGQLLASPLLAILYAVPGFLAALLIVKLVHHSAAHAHHAAAQFQSVYHVKVSPHAASLWTKTQAIWTGSWDKKVIGYGASLFVGRRPMRKVFDDVQLWFAERRLLLGKSVRFYHPPTFKARFNGLKMSEAPRPGGTFASGAGINRARHQGALNTVLTGGILVGLAFAGFGYYVLTYIAQ